MECCIRCFFALHVLLGCPTEPQHKTVYSPALFVQRLIVTVVGIFEGNVVHYEADQLEGLATKFCSEAVGTLLDGGNSAFHGAMTTDWALKGAESSKLQELIRYFCHAFTMGSSPTRMQFA